MLLRAPFIAHLALVAVAVLLWWNSEWALYIIAADTLLFLVLGIHNAWDTVTYVAIKHRSDSKPPTNNNRERTQ